MSLENGEISYVLKKPCTIHTGKGTGIVEWKTSVLKEPTSQHAKYALKIEQYIGQAVLDAKNLIGDKESEGSAQEQEATPITQIDSDEYEDKIKRNVTLFKLAIVNSNRVDPFKFLETFSKMALAATHKAIILCNGEERLKQSYWEALSLQDQTEMAYLWAAFFAMPSCLNLT